MSLTDSGRPDASDLSAVPQREHDEVLRMGQAERLEQWAVNRKHRPLVSASAKHDLTFECQRVDVS